MNALNRFTTRVFDVVLVPFELLGPELALVLVSGVFGVLALIVFKHISWQQGIKRTKDRVKGHMIAIRIYQDDLGIVARSVAGAVGRNAQYVGLNFATILPLLVPFVLVAAQLVVRYGFEPLPVRDPALEGRLAGAGTVMLIEMDPAQRAAVADLAVHLPAGLRPLSPLVRNGADGVAFQEVAAVRPGDWEVVLEMPDGRRAAKRVVVGDTPARTLQPYRVSSFWEAWLWPAEDTFPKGFPVADVRLDYPERDLRFLPGGPVGVLVVFFLASIAFGLVVLKPLGVQI